MAPDKDSSLPGDGSFLMGAIFMSNRTTKKECFRRKLFGLPSSRANFVKKIKVGMVLFLFEYEERKLYGVFESTTDGAMDIIPTAFTSSGKVFSAQVSFRRIWHCYPLTEAEFYDAIKDNYYAHNKFHFHLSETQVYKLLSLFDSKKVSNQQQCNRDSKFVSQYSSHPSEKNYDDSDFQEVDAFRGNIPVSSQDDPFYQPVPGLHLEELSTYSVPDDTSVNEHANYAGGSLDSNPFSRHQCYYSPPNQETVFPSSISENVGVFSNSQDASYPVHESSNCRLTALASKDIRDSVSLTNLQDSATKCFQNRGNITNLLNSYYPSSPGFYDPCAPAIFPIQENYMDLHRDVTTSGFSPERTQMLTGLYASTLQFDDNSRGPRYFRVEPREIILHSEYEPSGLEIIESPFWGNPEKVSSGMLFDGGPSENQTKNLSSYNLNQDDECYPDGVTCKFYSDARERRTSVFLRLSGLKKSPVEQIETDESDFGVSLDELIGSLSSRKKYWTKMKEVPNFKKPTRMPTFKVVESAPAFKNVYKMPDQFVMSEDGKQVENADILEPESTILSCRDEEIENSTALPFLNFKRRSEAQRISGKTETSSSIEIRETEASLVKQKRRKLLRPSFSEEVFNKVGDCQKVSGSTEELLLKVHVGESNSMDGACSIGNNPHEATQSGCSAGGMSRGHLMDQVSFVAGEHMGNVISSPMSQIDAAKISKLNSESATSVKGQSKFQNVEESPQNLQGGLLCVGNGNNNGVSEHNASGGKDVEGEIWSLGAHNDNAEIYASNIAYGEQCKFSIVHDPSKIGEKSRCIEYDSDKNVIGGERSHGAECPGNYIRCNCKLEGSFEGHVDHTSVRAIPDIRTEEEFDGNCKKPSQESLSSCAEEIRTGESPSDNYIHKDESADCTTEKSRGKGLPCEVALSSEVKTSQQALVIATRGSFSEAGIVEAAINQQEVQNDSLQGESAITPQSANAGGDLDETDIQTANGGSETGQPTANVETGKPTANTGEDSVRVLKFLCPEEISSKPIGETSEEEADEAVTNKEEAQEDSRRSKSAITSEFSCT